MLLVHVTMRIGHKSPVQVRVCACTYLGLELIIQQRSVCGNDQAGTKMRFINCELRIFNVPTQLVTLRARNNMRILSQRTRCVLIELFFMLAHKHVCRCLEQSPYTYSLPM